MPTMIFSNESRYWRPLCAGSLFPESSVPGPGNCEICVTPTTPEPPAGTGTSAGTGTGPSAGTGGGIEEGGP